MAISWSAIVACVIVGWAAMTVDGVPCSSQHLAVFKDASVAGPLNKCMSSSEVKIPMPPTTELTPSQRQQICDERECKEMIAAVDDLEVPRCDILFNGKNMTLQMSLDRFTAICDNANKAPPKQKKKSSSMVSTAAASMFSMTTAVGVLVLGLWISVP